MKTKAKTIYRGDRIVIDIEARVIEVSPGEWAVHVLIDHPSKDVWMKSGTMPYILACQLAESVNEYGWDYEENWGDAPFGWPNEREKDGEGNE